MAHCMILDAHLLHMYWAEAVNTATYLQNRLPTKPISKTPFELWTGEKPDLSHLKMFGSRAYVWIPSNKRSKMDAKSKKILFVGYSSHHKAYRFIDPETWPNELKMSIREGHASKSSSPETVMVKNPDSGRIRCWWLRYGVGGQPCSLQTSGGHKTPTNKMANDEVEQFLLATERRIYARLPKARGSPRLIDAGTYRKRDVLVLKRLGPSQQELLDLCGGRFGLKTVSQLALQLLARPETFHDELGYVHCDLKPDNVLRGRGTIRKKLHLIDFGFAEPRDDILSLTYMLVFLLRGGLPWYGTEERIDPDEALRLKLKTTPSEL
ncbi:casein kinase I-like, partial [Anopheles merus]|uniref:casein kinase I-like n=1 Tax=Anopheles merus TaxID=30066 RepID=UPI001BE414C1